MEARVAAQRAEVNPDGNADDVMEEDQPTGGNADGLTAAQQLIGGNPAPQPTPTSWAQMGEIYQVLNLHGIGKLVLCGRVRGRVYECLI